MSNAKKFPYWFFLGILLNNSSWIVSWLHIPIVSDYTFFPLWLGFALFLDGLNYYQKGSSMLSRDPIAYLCLFLLSSTFWFYFEGIVFVTQNWYYISTTRFSTFSYQLIASLSFSTILPAILELIELVWTDKVKNKTIKIIRGSILKR